MTEDCPPGELQLTERHHRRLAELVGVERSDNASTGASAGASSTGTGRMTPKLITSLRKDFGSQVAALILDSVKLQTKAVKKFGPGVWWCTERSIQQSTAWQVAAVKASWIGGGDVTDLCCGIGGDSIALARRGATTSVDSDPVMIALLRANARAAGVTLDSQVADAATISVGPETVIHVDPDRRPGDRSKRDRRTQDRRVSRPELYRPDWSTVTRLLDGAAGGWIKLAPAAEVVVPADWHRCYLSLQGSVREQAILTGGVRPRGCGEVDSVSAAAIGRDGSVCVFRGSAAGREATSSCEVGEILVDPDPAIRAAGLTESFAAAHGLGLINGPAGFLTGQASSSLSSSSTAASMCRVGRIRWVGATDDRELRRVVRDLDARVTVVRSRGCDVNPTQLTRRYHNDGGRPATLWIGRRNTKKATRFAALTWDDELPSGG